MSRRVLNISREESTTSLGNLFQCSITLRGKKFFLTFRQNFLCFSLCLLWSCGAAAESCSPCSGGREQLWACCTPVSPFPLAVPITHNARPLLATALCYLQTAPAPGKGQMVHGGEGAKGEGPKLQQWRSGTTPHVGRPRCRHGWACQADRGGAPDSHQDAMVIPTPREAERDVYTKPPFSTRPKWEHVVAGACRLHCSSLRCGAEHGH